jgi:DNA invertase Pin-like site-specific DNA recombinase
VGPPYFYRTTDDELIRVPDYTPENRTAHTYILTCKDTTEFNYTDKRLIRSKKSRPEFDNMLNDTKKRKFDVVLVWKLDRLSRSLKHLLNTLDLLNSLNVGFISYSDNFDTTTAQGKLMFSIVGAFAEFEISVIQGRVRLGLKLAVVNGTNLGRPKLNVNKHQVIDMQNQGMRYKQIAKKLKISLGSAHKIINGS